MPKIVRKKVVLRKNARKKIAVQAASRSGDNAKTETLSKETVPSKEFNSGDSASIPLNSVINTLKKHIKENHSTRKKLEYKIKKEKYLQPCLEFYPEPARDPAPDSIEKDDSLADSAASDGLEFPTTLPPQKCENVSNVC